jgi:cytochrome c-type biogenesis protein CcmF
MALMTVLGNLLLFLALFSAGAASFIYFRAAAGRSAQPALPRLLVRIHASLVVLASAVLLVLLITHDYSNGYVFSYSDRSLPLHYLVSSFYAGQEGSFLFWALCSSLIAIVLLDFSRKRKTELAVMTAFMAVQTFLLFLVTAKSPFRSLWDMFPQANPGQIPADGRGLNPLLQNFWMVIHPPVLFLGFAAMAVPFSLAIAGLWKRQYDILTGQSFPWLLFASSVLGLGIMLGGYWAYGVLGWGGYWGWDPVENSSLVPWLTSIGLLHTLLAQLRTGKYARTNFILAILSFLLVVYSTFLTRSGILGDASVHAFTDPGATVYWLLLGLLTLTGIAGVGLLGKRWAELRPEESGSEILTRETALGAGTIALLLSAAVVLFGTSLPIFSKIRVEPSFYDTTNLPIAIVMGLLIGFSLFIQWETQDVRETLRRSWKSFAAALAVTLVLVVAGVRNAVAASFIFASLFALFVNAEIAIRVAKGDPRFLGGKIAHIGLALFFLGVISTGKFSTTERLALPLNEPREALGYTFTYTGAVATPDGKQGFPVRVERDGSSFVLTPVMFTAPEQGVMKNPDIASSLTRDVYLSPLSLEQSAANAGAGAQYTLPKGEPVMIGGTRTTFVKFDMSGHSRDAMTAGAGGMAVGSILEVEKGDSRETITPLTIYRGNEQPTYKPAESKLLSASVRLVAMDAGSKEGGSAVVVDLLPAGTANSEMLIADASIKPYINLLWMGTLLMMVGFVLAILKRSKES